MAVSAKLNVQLLHNLPIPLLGIYPTEIKAETQTDTCTPMFTAALFTPAKSGNNLNAHWCMNRCGIHIQLNIPP